MALKMFANVFENNNALFIKFSCRLSFGWSDILYIIQYARKPFLALLLKLVHFNTEITLVVRVISPVIGISYFVVEILFKC